MPCPRSGAMECLPSHGPLSEGSWDELMQLAFLSSNMGAVFGSHGRESHAIQLKIHPPPFSSLLSSLHAFFLHLHPCLLSSPAPCLPHSLSGRAMPDGPAQRVMAAAEARSIGSFHSESGFHFWGQGAGQLTHTLTACRLWRGTSMAYGCSPPLFPRFP